MYWYNSNGLKSCIRQTTLVKIFKLFVIALVKLFLLKIVENKISVKTNTPHLFSRAYIFINKYFNIYKTKFILSRKMLYILNSTIMETNIQ